MQSRIDAAALGALLAAVWVVYGGPWAPSARGAAADVWPTQVSPPVDEAALNQRIAGLDAAAAALPPELLPTIRFEQAFVRIMARSAESDWLPGVRAMAEATGVDPVTSALRDVAKAWVARAQMREVGEVLDNFYTKHVRYPASLSEVARDLPKDVQTDPWGEPWVYATHAPAGFAREVLQRYTLGPKRAPELGTLKEATVQRPLFTPPPWKITLRPVGDGRALEFRNGSTVVGLLQAGGKLGVYALVYIGDHWALMSAPDQLFTVTF